MVTIHLCLIITTMLFVLYADEQGLAWMLGKKQTLNARTLEVLHTITGIGLSLIILTGGLMFMDRSTYLLSTSTFLIKMPIVLALVINSFAIGGLAHIAASRPFSSVTRKERRRIYISGGISVLGWLGAITCGLLL